MNKQTVSQDPYINERNQNDIESISTEPERAPAQNPPPPAPAPVNIIANDTELLEEIVELYFPDLVRRFFVWLLKMLFSRGG